MCVGLVMLRDLDVANFCQIVTGRPTLFLGANGRNAKRALAHVTLVSEVNSCFQFSLCFEGVCES